MKIRKWIIIFHRDLGYFFAGTTLLYALSGIAVNHKNDWNPSTSTQETVVPIHLPAEQDRVTTTAVKKCLEEIGHAENYSGHAFPSPGRIKIYLKQGSIDSRWSEQTGILETSRKRFFFFQANLLHLQPKTWWLVFSDAFCAGLIILAITGLFMLRGKKGLKGRGKWLVGFGLVIPVLAFILF